MRIPLRNVTKLRTFHKKLECQNKFRPSKNMDQNSDVESITQNGNHFLFFFSTNTNYISLHLPESKLKHKILNHILACDIMVKGAFPCCCSCRMSAPPMPPPLKQNPATDSRRRARGPPTSGSAWTCSSPRPPNSRETILTKWATPPSPPPLTKFKPREPTSCSKPPTRKRAPPNAPPPRIASTRLATASTASARRRNCSTKGAKDDQRNNHRENDMKKINSSRNDQNSCYDFLKKYKQRIGGEVIEEAKRQADDAAHASIVQTRFSIPK